ncbi:hypothetical protein VTI74DRAFT_11663 [Chaetomium olivicolor]
MAEQLAGFVCSSPAVFSGRLRRRYVTECRILEEVTAFGKWSGRPSFPGERLLGFSKVVHQEIHVEERGWNTRKLSQTLKSSNVPFAIVGGAAFLLLGSGRITTDVDLVMPKGRIKGAQLLLKARTDEFAAENRTSRTTYLSEPSIEIQVIAPPALFKEPFDESTETIEVMDGILETHQDTERKAPCHPLPRRRW